MDNMGCTKAPSTAKKGKKKSVKDELDRMKQAEKKKRRLEKALATSAAIISELEEKKQKKKDEQQRLDEEGAAIAEAVALHVLLGEDADDCRGIVMEETAGFNYWNNFPSSSLEGLGWFSGSFGSGCKWGESGNRTWSLSQGSYRSDFSYPYIDGDSTGLVAAQAVSSLRIAEDAVGLDAYIFNELLRG